MALSANNQIPAKQAVTVFFSCIVGPLTTPAMAQQGIYNLFADTSFNVTDVEIPILSTGCTLVGVFDDQDGAGHSAPGRNFLEYEFETFFLSNMQQAPGVYEVSISQVVFGAQKPAISTWDEIWNSIAAHIPSLTAVSVGLVIVLLLVVAVAVFVWKEG